VDYNQKIVRHFKIQEALLLYSHGLVSFGRAAEVNQKKKNVTIALGEYYIFVRLAEEDYVRSNKIYANAQSRVRATGAGSQR
jgi:hypothetical protein